MRSTPDFPRCPKHPFMLLRGGQCHACDGEELARREYDNAGRPKRKGKFELRKLNQRALDDEYEEDL